MRRPYNVQAQGKSDKYIEVRIEMGIDASFDGGNIEVVDAADVRDIRLRIRKDHQSDFYQWFYFRVSGIRGHGCRISIVNAGGAAFPGGFRDYRVLCSFDRQQWFRHPTRLEDGILRFDFNFDSDAVWIAYFVPYSMERHHDLLARASRSPRCRLTTLGRTLDGQPLDLVRFSSGKGSRNCWIIARQHPGETMAEWWMEGALEYLCGEQASSLLAKCDLYLVPNMNPDGSLRGHLRTNAAGRNLNREWAAPTMEGSPEVALAQQAMDTSGADFLLDVHGDEALPFCFIAGTEGLPDWDARKQARLDFYRERLVAANPDFQTRHGYPPNSRGKADMGMSTNQTARRHGCLAMTLEMPFKDNANAPDERHGWSPERSRRLAVSCLEVLEEYLDSGLA